MHEVVLFAGGFWLGLVLGAAAGYYLRPPSASDRWRESAEYRRHVGEPADPRERT